MAPTIPVQPRTIAERTKFQSRTRPTHLPEATALVPDRRANAARLLAALSLTRPAREPIRTPPTSAARTSPPRRTRRLCLVMDQAVLRVARRIAVLPPAQAQNGQLARSRRAQPVEPCTAGMA